MTDDLPPKPAAGRVVALRRLTTSAAIRAAARVVAVRALVVPGAFAAARVAAAWAVAAVVLMPLPGGAAGTVERQDKIDATSERAKITVERAEIMARFTARERECRTRFVVTSCVDEARREQRQALEELRARQHTLDEQARHARAAKRREELETKARAESEGAQERAERAAAAGSVPEQSRTGRPFETPRRTGSPGNIGPKDRPRSTPRDLGIKSHREEDPAERRAREERSRETYEARQREAAEHRQEVLEQAAKRLRERAPARPLPLPPELATPARSSSAPRAPS